jgi:signal transduction histidine kinase
MNGLSTPEAVGELRHELRTPLNLIIGYCEMLLEDATAPAHRTGLERALQAGRDILDRVATALPPTRGEVSGSDIVALFDSLRAPQGEIRRGADPDGGGPDRPRRRDGHRRV